MKKSGQRRWAGTRRTALAAMLSALALICLAASAFLPPAEFCFEIIAGLFPAAAMIQSGIGAGFLSYAVSGALALMLLPNREVGLFFLLCFGLYPLLKYFIEDRRWKHLVEWICKLAVCEGILLVLWFFFHALLFEGSDGPLASLWVYLPLGTGFFVIYDLALTTLIDFYMRRIFPAVSK